MDTRHLQNFLVVVECGSISRAAQKLGLSQPSLSQQILRLEDEVGQPLLRRLTSGVALTEAGRVFLEHAQSIIRQVELSASDLLQVQAEAKGAITLGLTNSITNLAGYDFYLNAQRDLPGVVVTMIDAMSGRIQEMVEGGSIDIGILYNVDRARGILTKEVGREQLYLVATPSFIVKNDIFGPTDLTAGIASHLPLVLPSTRHSLRRFIEERMHAIGEKPNIAAEVDVLSLIKSFLIGGSFCSILSLGAVWEEVKNGQLTVVPIGGANLFRTIYTARSPHKKITNISVRIEDILISTIRNRLDRVGLG